MGVVYRAHDEHLDREVAIKVLPSGILSDESARRRLRKEARSLSKLNHPNVATVHDFDSQDDIDYLVMEYVPGKTLRDTISEGQLPQAEIIRLATQLARGLTAAHERGLVHRDLKPENLRLTLEGRLKILDFGLAELIRPLTTCAQPKAIFQWWQARCRIWHPSRCWAVLWTNALTYSRSASCCMRWQRDNTRLLN
jgi:serine/threonine protein kinase